MHNSKVEGKIRDWIVESNNGPEVLEAKKKKAMNHIREELQWLKKKGYEITYNDLPFQIKNVLAAYDVPQEEFEKTFRSYLTDQSLVWKTK